MEKKDLPETTKKQSQKNQNKKTPQKAPPAVSHMFWFFVIPAVCFIVWVSFLLTKSLTNQPTEQGTLISQVKKIDEARSSGDRWQRAYALAEDLQKKIHSGDFQNLEAAEGNLFFQEIHRVLKKHQSDLRLSRYILLTLSHIGDLRALPSVELFLSSKDSEIEFYASWSYLKILAGNKQRVEKKELDRVVNWLQHSDLALRKIATSFLVQFGSEYQKTVYPLLSDKDREVRWNTVIALASVQDPLVIPHMKAFFEIEEIRSFDLNNAKDLKQLLATAVEGAKKLQSSEVLQKAQRFKESVSKETPEGRAILSGLSSL